MTPVVHPLALLVVLFSVVAFIQGIPLPSDGNSNPLLGLSQAEAYNLLKDSLDNTNNNNENSQEPLSPMSDETLSSLYSFGDHLKADDEKRKFSAWAGKRSEVAIPWGNVLRLNPQGGATGGIIRRGFNPWAGKRAFQPWAGKRSNDGGDDMMEEKRAFQPWAGKRSDVASDKRGFKPWAGKRSDVEAQQSQFEDDLADFMEKRSFSPWLGKRAKPSGKRVFKPWAGK